MDSARPPATPILHPHLLRDVLNLPGEFVELLPVAAYACDASGRLLWFNRRAEALWGRRPHIGDGRELYCGSHRLFFDGREISRDETPMARVLTTGEAVDGVEGILERLDGTRVRAMVHISPVKDESGRVVGAINCFHDTTELHRVSEALREKQEELEDFFENCAVPLHIVSAEGIIVRANKAEQDLLGYESEEYVGHAVTEFHADASTIEKILVRLRRGQKLDRYPATLIAKDGTLRLVAITSSPRFQNGRFINTRCFTQDITQEVQAKEMVAESEERYRQLLDSLPAAVYTTDGRGRITYYNQAAVQMSGRTPELGTDKWCVSWRLYNPDGSPLPHDKCPMAVALQENRPIRNVEAVAERPDGTRVSFLPYPTPLYDRSGNITGAVNMLIDISERKEAESRQIMLLRELNHRVKNNMQMLQSLLNGAQRETKSPEARAVLKDATARVAAMAAAQRVLYEEGTPTSFSARDFLESVCSTAQVAFNKQVTISIENAEGTLSNDTAMPLALVLNELLTNSVKHAINGNETGNVRVGFVREADKCRLWVEDEGPGFELPNDRRKRASGLGLVDGLVRQLGGTFAVERGTRSRCVIELRERPVLS